MYKRYSTPDGMLKLQQMKRLLDMRLRALVAVRSCQENFGERFTDVDHLPVEEDRSCVSKPRWLSCSS